MKTEDQISQRTSQRWLKSKITDDLSTPEFLLERHTQDQNGRRKYRNYDSSVTKAGALLLACYYYFLSLTLWPLFTWLTSNYSLVHKLLQYTGYVPIPFLIFPAAPTLFLAPHPLELCFRGWWWKSSPWVSFLFLSNKKTARAGQGEKDPPSSVNWPAGSCKSSLLFIFKRWL